MVQAWSRREWLATGAGLAARAALPAEEPADKQSKEPFGYCLNTATIMGQKLPIVQEIEIAAKAGYQGFEPWVSELKKFVEDGGSLKDLGKRLRDGGLSVPSAIGFAEWIVEDDMRRKKGLEQAKRDMDAVQQIGGTRLAAPPMGATDKGDLSLLKIADRYRDLLEAGVKIGVIPQVEVWGFSKTLSRLGEAAMVAVESGRPQACVLADVYHLHKGGSGFQTLALLGASAMPHLANPRGWLCRATPSTSSIAERPAFSASTRPVVCRPR